MILPLACLAVAAQVALDPHSQFLEAQRIQSVLEQQPESARTVRTYQLVVGAYRKVYFNTPGAQDATRALMQIGALYQEMGERFDRKYFHAAIVSYDFLLRGYPASQLRQDADFAIAQIEQKNLHARHDAEVSYRDFIQQFPDSPRVAEARAALAELCGSPTGPQLGSQNSIAKGRPGAPLSGRRHSPEQASSEDANAENPIAGDSVATQPMAAQVPAPLNNRINPENSPRSVVQQSAQWQSFSAPAHASGSYLPARISAVDASQGVGHTRVVMTVDRPVKFVTGRAHNPERIFFDIDGAHVAANLAAQPIQVNDARLKTIRLAQNRHDVVRVVLDMNHASNCAAYLLRDPDRLVIDVQDNGVQDGGVRDVGAGGASVADLSEPDVHGKTSLPNSTIGSPGSGKPPIPGYAPGVKIAEEKVDSNSPLSSSGDSSENNADEPVALAARYPVSHGASIPQPLHSGNRSLTRELGLKINRIVIDAGHGGHDTGTIGPHGVMEKTVCLDVALRLGKLIQKRLPGAEVVYTRIDDTFIPLEERTAIANREKADLFISIHANSSPSSSARGVETYYLNFATSPDAMQVATRENAVGESSVHELQSMIQKIARNEKVDESREFAADVQQSLYQRLQTGSQGMEDRGVKRAPFVVLIGAHMPSILSEIAFLSNTTDEKLLSANAQRERVAEGLYHGVESYLASLNSLAVSNHGPLSKDQLLARGNQR
jgi:N-acetylmuramoyl-L-alanine amidase